MYISNAMLTVIQIWNQTQKIVLHFLPLFYLILAYAFL